MKYAVVYYSRNGNTAIAAEYLSTLTEGKKVRLQAGKYLNNFFLGGFNASSERLPKLKGDPWGEISDSDRLILAFPVWAGKINPAMNSFMAAASFKEKQVYLLAVQADPGKTAQTRVLPVMAERVKADGGEIAGMLTIQGASPGKTSTDEAIIKQLSPWKDLLEQS